MCVLSFSFLFSLDLELSQRISLSLFIHVYEKNKARANSLFIAVMRCCYCNKTTNDEKFQTIVAFYFQKRNETKLRLWKNSSHDHFNILLTYIQRERVRFFSLYQWNSFYDDELLNKKTEGPCFIKFKNGEETDNRYTYLINEMYW